MRQRTNAAGTASATTIVDVEEAAAPAPAHAPSAAASSPWHSNNKPEPSSSAAVEWPPLEREPAPYSMPGVSAAAAGRPGAKPDTERCGQPWVLVTLVACACVCCTLLLVTVLGGDQAAAVRSGQGGVQSSKELELTACRRTLANLRARVQSLEADARRAPPPSPPAPPLPPLPPKKPSDAAQPAAAESAAAAAAAGAREAEVAEELAQLQASMLLLKMTAWESDLGSPTAEEDAVAAPSHEAQTRSRRL